MYVALSRVHEKAARITVGVSSRLFPINVRVERAVAARGEDRNYYSPHNSAISVRLNT